MHVQRTEHLRALHDDPVHALGTLTGGLRWRLGLERLALCGVRGVIASSVALIGVALAVWLTETPRSLLAIGLAPLVAALLVALVRWPSDREAALIADRRLGLHERLGTAVELLKRGDRGRFVERQVGDAVANALAAPRTWLVFERRTRYEVVLATIAVVFGVTIASLIPGLPRPFPTTAPSSQQAPRAAASVVDELAERALPTEGPVPATTGITVRPPAPQPSSPTDLANQVQQEQAERAALDGLARALSSVSPGQAVADAIQQGNYSAAADQLQTLADNADQLSDAAKLQLAKALQHAAGATAQADRALADRERLAAQALSRSTYAEQRQTLRNLADQLQRSGARSVSTAQLQRDRGKLEQQQASHRQSLSPQPGAQAGGPDDRTPGGNGQTQSAIADGQIGGGLGQQAGPGIGTGPNADPFSNQPSRLDTAGQQVQVPSKLGVGPGARPADGTQDPASFSNSTPGGQRAAELPRTQQTGQLAPEQNLVPGEQRPVVRGYFR